MLFYLAWRLRLLKPDVAVLLAVIVAALIGGSRIYLVEHYVSDVLNGYLVGALWLTLGIAFCEWYRASSRRQVSGALRGAAAVCFGGGALLAVYLTSTTVSTIKDFAGTQHAGRHSTAARLCADRIAVDDRGADRRAAAAGQPDGYRP